MTDSPPTQPWDRRPIMLERRRGFWRFTLIACTVAWLGVLPALAWLKLNGYMPAYSWFKLFAGPTLMFGFFVGQIMVGLWMEARNPGASRPSAGTATRDRCD